MYKRENYLAETEIRDLPFRDYKIMIIKMFTEVRRTVHEQSENFNQETENI